jgi:hypothetical protein
MGDPEKQPGPELERQTQKLGDHAVVRPQGGIPMRSSDLGPGEEAVVIGGSMAGLLAARVLADRFDRVTVIDRDRFPDGPQFRKGVPQSGTSTPCLPAVSRSSSSSSPASKQSGWPQARSRSSGHGTCSC